MKTKNRKQKAKEYQERYSEIPKDYIERLSYMCDIYNVNEKKFDEILAKKQAMLENLYYKRLKVVLYEKPEGSVRPRTRIITPKNYMIAAMVDKPFVHVYSPNAKDDSLHMKRLIDEELVELQDLICTPCICTFNAYYETPSSLSVVDKFMAETGLKRPLVKPDWDNVGKKYSDMYNENIWIDDSYSITGIVNKYYSILPRVEIELQYLNALYGKVEYSNLIKRTNYNGQEIFYLDQKGELVIP